MIEQAPGLFFLAGALLGCLFMIIVIALVPSFARDEQVSPRDEPAVTVLIPLNGDEPGLFENLAAFCRQDYSGDVQLLLGVADAGDAAIDVARRLQLTFPGRQIELLITSRLAGSNPKVSNLIGMSSRILHDIIVVVDSDIRVGVDHLRRVVNALERSDGGAVTCPYIGISGDNIYSQLARLAIDSHFLPAVIFGVRLKLTQPCFGSTIALRRHSFDAIGGFEAVANCLADDHAIGAALRERGEAVTVLPLAVGHICAERTWRELWNHEVRWAITIRRIDPTGYFGWGVTHAFPLALIAFFLSGDLPALALAAVALACRVGLVLAIERAYGLPAHRYWLIPLRDLLSFVVFVAGFAARAVVWKGRRFRLSSEYSPNPRAGSLRP